MLEPGQSGRTDYREKHFTQKILPDAEDAGNASIFQRTIAKDSSCTHPFHFMQKPIQPIVIYDYIIIINYKTNKISYFLILLLHSGKQHASSGPLLHLKISKGL